MGCRTSIEQSFSTCSQYDPNFDARKFLRMAIGTLNLIKLTLYNYSVQKYTNFTAGDVS